MRRLVVPLLLLLATIACNGSEPRLAEEAAFEAVPAAAPSPSPRLMATEWQEAEPAEPIEQRLIRTGTLQMTVDDARAAVANAELAAENLGGRLSDTTISSDAEGYQRADFTVEVPSARFDEAMSALAVLGEVGLEQVDTQDVTREYFDLETRLRVMRDTESRLRALLTSATGSVADIVEVERELTRVIEQIERMLGQQRYYDQRIAVSTIHVGAYEQPASVRPGLLTPITEALRDSLRVLAESIAAVIYAIVYLAPWALALWMVLTVRRRWRRRRAGAA